MIEEGIVQLVNANAAVKALVPNGGYMTQLPQNMILPTWSHQAISELPDHNLSGASGTKMRRLQIDCYGSQVQTIQIAKAINKVLDGFTGALPDADATFIQSCLQANLIDFYDDVPRTYHRMLEFEIWYDA